MSVDQTNVIDLISTNASGEVVLTVSDHLDWSDSVRHQTILQEKLNAYLAFAESGQMLREYPDSAGRTVVFDVALKFEPDNKGVRFLKRAAEVVKSAGFRWSCELFSEHSNARVV
jgi:hypothetical protein